jgi:filamentous hemagglutinin family protein
MGLPQRMAWALWGAGLMELGWPIGAYAQLTPDASLGMSSSTVSTFGTTDIIGGGLQRGTVRLHSFQDFNVAAGRRAFFTGATTILTRVTGSTPSTIDGMLEFSGSGDFFLLNPNGLIFGANAFLKVPGSFVGTTGRGIQIGGDRFSSNLADPLPGVLTIQPSALWLNGPMGPITNRSTIFGAGLFPGTGHRAILAGGAIQFDAGGKLTGNYVQVAGLGGTGFVPLISDGNPKLDLDSARSQGLVQGQINLLNGSRIWSFNAQNGAVEVAAQTLNLNNSGIQIFGQAPASGTLGPIQIQADTIALNNGSIIQAIAQPGTTINLGTIDISGRTLTVGVGSAISTAQLGQGSGGLVRLNLTDRITLDSQIQAANAYVGTSGSATSIGNTGNIEITTPDLRVLNGAVIGSTQRGQGSAGDITIRAQTITVSGRGSLSAQPSLIAADYGGSGGQAGRINIQAQSINLLDGGGIAAGGGPANGGTGNGGQINLDVSGSLILAGPRTSFLSAQAAAPSTGNGGTIAIRAGSVDLQANAGISVDGNQGGTLRIESGNITVDRANISAQGRSQGGTIDLTGTQLRLANSSSINASGPNAGRIQLQVQDLALANRGYIGAEGNNGSIGIQSQSVRLDNSGIATNGTTTGGQSGTIAISAPSLILDRSTLSAVNWSGGLGGRIDLKTSDLAVQNVSTIDVSGQRQSGGIQLDTTTFNLSQTSNLWANSVGQGGTIDVVAQGQINLADGANLVANGDVGGRITVQSTALSLVRDSSLTAAGEGGSGGTIAIRSGPVSLQNGDIQVNSTLGSAGLVTIDSSALSLENGSSLAARGANGGRIVVQGGPVTGLNSLVDVNGTGNGGLIQLAGPADFTLSDLRAIGQSGAGGRIDSADSLALTQSAIDVSGQRGGELQLTGPTSLSQSQLIAQGGSGGGGQILIQAPGKLNLDASAIDASGGSGGQVSLGADRLTLTQGSQIHAKGRDRGGSITITAPLITAFDNSDITTVSINGGGTIDVRTKAIVGTAFRRALTPNSDIIANWDGSGITTSAVIAGPNNGSINGVDNPEAIVRDRAIDASRNEDILWSNGEQVRIACQGVDESNGDSNEFYITGGRLLQPSPDRPLLTPLTAWRSAPKPERSRAEFSPVAAVSGAGISMDQRQEAQAWHRDGEGRIVLGAQGERLRLAAVSGCWAGAVGRGD